MTYNNITNIELDNLVKEHLPLVNVVAKNLTKKLATGVQFDDMFQAGSAGLLQAIRRFDGSSGVPFAIYARFRIKGSMLDELRTMDYVGKTERKRINNIKKKKIELEKAGDGHVSNKQIADSLEISINSFNNTKKIESMSSVVSYDTFVNEHNEDDGKYFVHGQPDFGDDTPEPNCIRQEHHDLFKRCIDQLPKQQKTIINFYYNDDLSGPVIAKKLNVSNSLVQEEKIRAEKKITEMMKPYV